MPGFTFTARHNSPRCLSAYPVDNCHRKSGLCAVANSGEMGPRWSGGRGLYGTSYLLAYPHYVRQRKIAPSGPCRDDAVRNGHGHYGYCERLQGYKPGGLATIRRQQIVRWQESRFSSGLDRHKFRRTATTGAFFRTSTQAWIARRLRAVRLWSDTCQISFFLDNHPTDTAPDLEAGDGFSTKAVFIQASLSAQVLPAFHLNGVEYRG